MYDIAVVGLGYVGLPLLKEASSSGLTSLGYDINPRVIAELSAGRSHIDDISDAQVRDMLKSGFVATCKATHLKSASAIVICVPTPLDVSGGPDLAAVRQASIAVAKNMSRGTTIVLESTTYPGTTAEIVIPLLEQESGMKEGVDFWVAYSPERIDPGNQEFGFRNTPKVVGADSPEALRRASDVYSKIVDQVVHAAGTREAEAAKLLENTYRHVNIALVNEMAKFFHELDIDFWNVVELASTKPFGFKAFYPGPGVGGHCIPIDPNYLAHRVRSELGYAFKFVELAQDVNSSMPAYVVRRIGDALNRRSLSIRDRKILLLGVAYKANISDDRESPSREIAERLRDAGAEVRYFDPHVVGWGLAEEITDDLDVALRDCDLAVLLQLHAAFDMQTLHAWGHKILDTRGQISSAESL